MLHCERNVLGNDPNRQSNDPFTMARGIVEEGRGVTLRVVVVVGDEVVVLKDVVVAPVVVVVGDEVVVDVVVVDVVGGFIAGADRKATGR